MSKSQNNFAKKKYQRKDKDKLLYYVPRWVA